MPQASTRKWLRAGTVGSPHGLDGSFHVSEATPALPGVGATVMVAERERSIDRRAGSDLRPILRLEGSGDRDAARALRGQDLMISRSGAPPLEADEWWAEDLEGCAVHDAGRPVGTVRRLKGLPSCEVLEVVRTDGGADLLVPLVRDAVRAVDIGKREIEIDLRFLGED